MVTDKSKYVDQQTLKMQENPEVMIVVNERKFDRLLLIYMNVCLVGHVFSWLLKDVPTGELPRNMLLSLDRHLVQTIVPGTRLTIMGIYSIYQASNSASS